MAEQRRYTMEEFREAMLSEEAVEASVRRREPLVSNYTRIAMTKVVVDARLDLEAALDAAQELMEEGHSG